MTIGQEPPREGSNYYRAPQDWECTRNLGTPKNPKIESAFKKPQEPLRIGGGGGGHETQTPPPPPPMDGSKEPQSPHGLWVLQKSKRPQVLGVL